MAKKSFRDLKDEISLKDGEIDELNIQLAQKNDEINKLKLYSTKFLLFFICLSFYVLIFTTVYSPAYMP